MITYMIYLILQDDDDVLVSMSNNKEKQQKLCDLLNSKMPNSFYLK